MMAKKKIQKTYVGGPKGRKPTEEEKKKMINALFDQMAMKRAEEARKTK